MLYNKNCVTKLNLRNHFVDDPEEFFKKNMTNMLSTKLEDMFTKVSIQIYLKKKP